MAHPGESGPLGTLRDGIWIKKQPSYYTPAQVSKWLSCIGFNTLYTETEISTGVFSPSLENLHVVVRLHQIAFPFENIAMHYTSDHTMDVSPEGAFRRLVLERKGSYCFGLNGVLFGMLRGLGYRAYAGAARVNMTHGFLNPPDFDSLTHMVIFVQPLEGSNVTYLVDTGFGGSGLTRPLLLSNAEDNVVMGTSPTEKHRLTRGSHPETSLEAGQNTSVRGDYEWRLEVWHEGNDSHTPWRTLYTFSEREHFTIDFDSWSFEVSMRRGRRIFWEHLICVKHFLLGDDDIDTVEERSGAAKAGVEAGDHVSLEPSSGKRPYMGRIIMFDGEIRRQVGSRSEVIRKYNTDLERILALREVFGIAIADEDAVYIQGRAAAMK